MVMDRSQLHDGVLDAATGDRSRLHDVALDAVRQMRSELIASGSDAKTWRTELVAGRVATRLATSVDEYLASDKIGQTTQMAGMRDVAMRLATSVDQHFASDKTGQMTQMAGMQASRGHQSSNGWPEACGLGVFQRMQRLGVTDGSLLVKLQRGSAVDVTD